MFRMITVFLFYGRILAVVNGIQYAPTVQTSFGKVRGTIEILEDNSTLYLYKGIKYGIAERFQKPRFVEPWTGILDAVQYRDACPQTGKRMASKDVDVEMMAPENETVSSRPPTTKTMNQQDDPVLKNGDYDSPEMMRMDDLMLPTDSDDDSALPTTRKMRMDDLMLPTKRHKHSAKKMRMDDLMLPTKRHKHSTKKMRMDDLMLRDSNEDAPLPATETISEDCLFLNVWQPLSQESSNLLPVMVWVHGGSFRSGTIFYDAYDARYIAQKGPVVVVSINYRLGPFGFLYAGNEQAPGNQGLHDQILALKWVQANIQKFGGDPNRVTVFGESAGSMSVGTLVLSPLTENLFRRAILQSGAPNSFMGTRTKHQALKISKDFAKRLECPTKHKSVMVQCLRRKHINEILDASEKDFENLRLMHPMHGDELMPISPVAALKTPEKLKRIDLMFGVTRNEGAEFVSDLFPILVDPNRSSQLRLEDLRNMIRTMMKSLNDSNPEEVVQLYTGHLPIRFGFDYLKSLVADVFGDYNLVCPTMLFGKYFARATSANASNGSKHYSYSYRLSYPLHGGPFSGNDWQGVIHGEDFVYLFIIPNNPKEYTPFEVQLSDDMIKAWTKFAYDGHPSIADQVQWTEALDYQQPNSSVRFMELDPTGYGMVENEYRKRCDQFWESRIFRDDDPEPEDKDEDEEEQEGGGRSWSDLLWRFFHWFFWI